MILYYTGEGGVWRGAKLYYIIIEWPLTMHIKYLSWKKLKKGSFLTCLHMPSRDIEPKILCYMSLLNDCGMLKKQRQHESNINLTS